MDTVLARINEISFQGLASTAFQHRAPLAALYSIIYFVSPDMMRRQGNPSF